MSGELLQQLQAQAALMSRQGSGQAAALDRLPSGHLPGAGA